jgi:hypothetical protein
MLPAQASCVSRHRVDFDAVQDREYALAKQLAGRLHQFVAGDEEGFLQATRDEAARLARLPFGVPILHRIGCASRLMPSKHSSHCKM